MFRYLPTTGDSVDGAGEGIRTPDLLITNQLLYRPELRQPDKEQIIALPVPVRQVVRKRGQAQHLSWRLWGASHSSRTSLPYCLE